MDMLFTTVVFALAFVTVLVALTLRRESLMARQSRVLRLQGEEQGQLDTSAAVKRVLKRSIPQWSANLHFIAGLEELLLQSGIYWTLGQFLGFSAVLSAIALIGTLLLWGDWQFSLIAMLGAAVLPYAYLVVRKRRRLDAFVKQFPFALDVIKSSLEAGHTLQRALQVLVREFEAPLGTEFRLVLEQTRIGVSLPKALEDLAGRMPESDLRMLVVAVRVQSDIGSNLAPIVGRLAELVRARQRLQQQVKTFSVSLRLGGVVVALLPVIVLTIFAISQPDYTRILFTDRTGTMLLKTAIICDLLALWIVRRLMRIEY